TSISVKPCVSPRLARRLRASCARRARSARRANCARYARVHNWAILEATEWGNFHASRQPVDANLVPGSQTGERDDAAARHAAGKEADGRPGRTLIAAVRQHSIETHIIRLGTGYEIRVNWLTGGVEVAPLSRL